MSEQKTKFSIRLFLKKFFKTILIFPAIALGIFVLVQMLQNRKGPEQEVLPEFPKKVQILTIKPLEVLPRTLSYGHVEPDSIWEAVAEVSGKIIEMEPELKKGALLKKNTLLFKIDSKDYEYAVAQIEAEISNIKAQLEETTIRQNNTESSLRIEQDALNFAQTELERLRKLKNQNTVVSQSTVDKQEQSVLGYSQSVQNLKNSLNLFPAQKKVLAAKLAVAEAQLKSAQLNIERTTIILPIDARVSEVLIEKSQFAKQGQVLVRVDSIQRAEISAQIPIEQAKNLVVPDEQINIQNLDLKKIIQSMNLKATVRMYAGTFKIEWEARLLRISESVDPQTRSIGFIVAVDQPYQQAKLGIRPPLMKNMFVEVELQGKKRSSCFVVPRSALYHQQVYVVNSKNRLEKRFVDVDFSQSDFVVILPANPKEASPKKGLLEGDRVVLSDLVPAIEGMLLNPVEDLEMQEKLLQETQGQVDLK